MHTPHLLLCKGCSYSPRDSFDYTPLQKAVRKGSLEQVKLFIANGGVDLNVGPDPALHLALRKQNTSIALFLIRSGADYELRDSHGDYPIHIGCALGLLTIVQELCSLGCSLEVATVNGLSPLHLAAKNGHIHVVRCLCSSGCNIDIRNSDNIRADITALKYGHNDIAELLDRLRVGGVRDHLARQLVPTSRPACRLNVRLLGHCGVGKTALIKSLSAGLFSSLFRRSSSLTTNKSRPSSPITGPFEMDVTSRQNSLSFESSGNYNSTNGIHVQTVDISNVGEVTVWEFSGQENYFPLYHHFLYPSPFTLTLILFNLEEPHLLQVQQVCFWLNFLHARQPADLEYSDCGQIMLIATHVDQTRAVKGPNGEWNCPDAQMTLDSVRRNLTHIQNLSTSVIAMDCNVPAAHAFKQLKSLMNEMKLDCVQKTVGFSTALLEAALAWLPTLQKDYEQFPVLRHATFAALLRNHINILASDQNIDELLNQLHYFGEVFYIDDLVVVAPNWFTTHILGELFSLQFLLHCRATGVYTVDDFQASFNHCDALGVLELLQALNICIECDLDGEIEYEFPVYNQIERLDGLWEGEDARYCNSQSKYAGIRLYPPPKSTHLLKAVFPHVQVSLRRAMLQNDTNNDSDSDLYQWYLGSKLCNGDIETIITLEEQPDGMQCIEMKIRAFSPPDTFYFFDNLIEIVLQAIAKVCPNLIVERHILSAAELKAHASTPYCYEPDVITAAMLEAESTLDLTFYNPNIDTNETLVDLILFGDTDLSAVIHWGCVLRSSQLDEAVKVRLCTLLDPPEPRGIDWCLLAVRLGLRLDDLDASPNHSNTMAVLTAADCSIGELITTLHELCRTDAADIVLRSAPFYKLLECTIRP